MLAHKLDSAVATTTSIADDPSTTLVVDLDDTLVRTDLLFEQILRLFKSSPQKIPRLFFWLLSGRARFKQKLANNTTVDPSRLPYHQAVLECIELAHNKGQKVILASASHESVVHSIAEHLGCFDAVIATSVVNLKGQQKLDAIRSRLGDKPFVYIGDSRSDLALWQHSAKAIAINPARSVARDLNRLGVDHEIIQSKDPRLNTILKQMRVFQWAKNSLVFLPLLAGHHFLDKLRWRGALIAAAAFSLLASAVYVMNDMLDVDADRAHHSKNRRPFASGDLPLKTGFLLMPLLLAGSALISLPLSGQTQAYLGMYFLLNVAYSWRLKEVVLIDTVTLAGFYTLRILAGGSAANTPVSQWLLSFSIFFFFGLAMVKRYTELLRGKGSHHVEGRGYSFNDKQAVFVTGVASSFLAILICVLYLNGREVAALYSRPDYLWLLAPILLYWSSRVWLLAQRGELHEDPVVFAVRDRDSWIVAILIAGILALAI